MKDERFKQYRQFLSKTLPKIINKLPILVPNEENLIQENLDYIKDKVGVNLILEREEESKEDKAKQAMPFKPSIVIKLKS